MSGEQDKQLHPAAAKRERAADRDRHDTPAPAKRDARRAKEIGGREGPDPTRYGDWERHGRCIDF